MLVSKEVQYPKFWTRFWAKLLDECIVISMTLIISYWVYCCYEYQTKPFFKDISELWLFLDNKSANLWLVWAYCGFSVIYYTGIFGKPALTIGKKIFAIKVLNNKTMLPISFREAIFRATVCLVVGVLLGLGFLPLFSSKKRALHDFISGCYCVKN